MSSRALRRLRGDELAAAPVPKPVEESEEEDTGDDAIGPKKSVFDILMAGNDAPDDVDEDEEEDAHATQRSDAKPSMSKSKKKRENRKKLKESKQQEEQEFEIAVEQVNKMLGELPVVNLPAAKTEPTATVKPRSSLLCETKYLNADFEMRNLFGAAVLAAAGAAAVNEGTTDARRKNARAHLAGLRKKKLLLAVPKDTWPQIGGVGLSMDFSLVDNAKVFRFVYSPVYQQVERKFHRAVSSMQVQAIANTLHAHPYHVNSLLQMSDYLKDSGDVPMANELLERALFVQERAWHSLFNIGAGDCQLDYRDAESRPMFLALFAQTEAVAAKSCWRTALELTKLLLMLDPKSDPLGALLQIDFFAIRSGEYAWLVKFYEEWEPIKNLSMLPNFAFSMALAYFELDKTPEGKLKADRMLQDAVLKFPGVVLSLIDAAKGSLPQYLANNTYFLDARPVEDRCALVTLYDIYFRRSAKVWSRPDALSFLTSNVASAIDRVVVNREIPLIAEYSSRRAHSFPTWPAFLSRHALLSGYRGTLPRSVTSQTIYMHDPLPPTDSRRQYSLEEPQVAREATSLPQDIWQLLTRSLLPSFIPEERRHVVETTEPPPDHAPPAYDEIGHNDIWTYIQQLLRRPANPPAAAEARDVDGAAVVGANPLDNYFVDNDDLPVEDEDDDDDNQDVE